MRPRVAAACDGLVVAAAAGQVESLNVSAPPRAALRGSLLRETLCNCNGGCKILTGVDRTLGT